MERREKTVETVREEIDRHIMNRSNRSRQTDIHHECKQTDRQTQTD